MQSDRWQDFHDGFVKLAEIQQQITRATRKGFLQADCNFADPEFVPIPKGPWCEVPTLGAAILELREGPDEHLKAQLELLATRAGKKLGCPGEVSPLKFWLWNLFMHLRKMKSEHLFAPTNQVQIGDNPQSDLLKPLAGLTFYRVGGTITNVCVASAIFCARLGKQAVLAQNSDKAEQSAESKPTKQHKALSDREQKLWEVIQKGLKATPPLRGTTYCREVDAAQVSPPRKGVWKDGPRTYVAAYNSGDKQLVHWIQSEKSKIRRKAELAGHIKTRAKLAGE